MTSMGGVGAQSRAGAGLVVVGLAGLVAVGAGLAVTRAPTLRAALAGGLVVAFVSLALRRPAHLLYLLVGWLACLGLVRRLVSQASPYDLADPLLLVAPISIGILVVKAAERGSFRHRSLLANSVALLSLFILIGALNPLQASLASGAGALLFLLVPPLAFWVGRSLSSETMRRVLKLVALVSVPAAVYGLGQTFRGFPPWDETWIRTAGYAALGVAGHIRPFGTFSSAAEYASFLALGLVVWLVFWFRPATIGFALAAASLIGAAVVFEASRSIIVYLLIGLALIAACRLRLPALVSACLVAGSLVGLVALSRYWAPRNGAGNAASALVTHNLEGLANPLDARTSTLGLHIDMAGEGLLSPLRYPLGRGPAVVTLAQTKFGGVSGSSEVVGSTEADPSNIAVALGVPGLVLYLLVVVLGFRGAYHLATNGHDPVAVACLAVLGVTLFQWFNGGQYAVAVLPWLALGYVDASLTRDRGLARAAVERSPARQPPSAEQTGDP